MRRKLTAEELRTRITEALMRDVGVSERMAQPFVDAMMHCFAGQQPYFPAPEKSYPVMHIKAALEAGERPRCVCRRFNISRSKLHQLFPGGLPKPDQSRSA